MPTNREDLNIVNLSVDDVRKAYRGKQGCMCGCLGTYHYHPDEPHEAWQGGPDGRRGIKACIKTMQEDALEVYYYPAGSNEPAYIKDNSGAIPVDCPFICYDYETATAKMQCVIYLKAYD